MTKTEQRHTIIHVEKYFMEEVQDTLEEESVDTTEETHEEETESKGPDLNAIATQQAVALKEERRKRKELEKKLSAFQKSEGGGSESPESQSSDVETTVRRVLEEKERREAESAIEEVLSELTADETEREATLSMYENRLKPSGFTRKSIETDLRTAYMLVNPSSIAKEVEGKVKKEVAQKQALSNATVVRTSTKGDEGTGQKQRLSRDEKRFMRGMGLQTDS